MAPRKPKPDEPVEEPEVDRGPGPDDAVTLVSHWDEPITEED